MRSLACFISNEYEDKIKCSKKLVAGYIVGWAPEFFSEPMVTTRRKTSITRKKDI